MKSKLYKHANIIFGTLGVCFAFLGFIVDKYSTRSVGHILWQTMISVYTIGGIIFGTHLSRLHESVNKDHLTGLWNRKFFFNQIALEIEKCKKNEYEISLLMIDIDNFKNINDNNGHQFGDEVIKKVADILNQSIRNYDTVARIGGEEFVVILPNTNSITALSIAERIRGNIEKESFILKNITSKVTISIGLTNMKDRFDMNQLVNSADKALYKSKETRNKVSIYEKE